MSTIASSTAPTHSDPDVRVDGPAHPLAPTALRPLALSDVSIGEGFWLDRQRANRDVSIPDGLRQLRDAGNLRNFEIAAGRAEGEAVGPIFADSDVYKWLEAAAWEYAREPDEQLLADQLEITELVSAAQEDDGYLNTVVRLREGERYRHPERNHEHYCAGHLIQAAVAQKRATGRDDLLNVAVRVADHLVREFGPRSATGSEGDVDGHPVVETALVELYRETGTEEYLDLARWFVDARGHDTLERFGGNSTYLSDRVPVREASTVEGHAVRAVYLTTGATDVAIETSDSELLATLGKQYDHMAATKQYVTGGLGARWDGEAFGDEYELPSDRAYAETCAAIGAVQWAWRMLLATGEASYGDQIERLLYNGFLAGVSLRGGDYFYVNPLQVRHNAHADDERTPKNGRLRWFGCACCPPNIMRTLSSLGGYLATSDSDGVQLHQYVSGAVRARTDAGEVELTVHTEYPWDGRVRVTVNSAPTAAVTLSLRVPAWAEGATLDGADVTPGRYATVTRAFAAGDTLEFVLPLTARVTRPHPRVDAVRGSVAVERGPLVYAFERADQPEGVVLDDVSVEPDSLSEAEGPDLVPGLVGISVRTRDGQALTGIPYFAWANRGADDMRVWLPEA
ncbi:glycoside hydrolase family 127 protein [Rathayibacter sp. KR2-224]|uniref:glycoside hydrolase family 127 protein n=1 Tax=Rathayibacter sp. KR2-224 TaxID=3400913 RepID=UPI003BFABC17